MVAGRSGSNRHYESYVAAKIGYLERVIIFFSPIGHLPFCPLAGPEGNKPLFSARRRYPKDISISQTVKGTSP
jgi:hypothetical protein